MVDGNVEVTTPGGWKARLNGMDTKTILVAVLVLACTSAIAYAFQEDRRTAEQYKQEFVTQHRYTQGKLDAVVTEVREAQRQTAERLDELTYVLTLDQRKREALKMEMPQSLRRKINER